MNRPSRVSCVDGKKPFSHDGKIERLSRVFQFALRRIHAGRRSKESSADPLLQWIGFAQERALLLCGGKPLLKCGGIPLERGGLRVGQIVGDDVFAIRIGDHAGRRKIEAVDHDAPTSAVDGRFS
jgi:hypothetical protein